MTLAEVLNAKADLERERVEHRDHFNQRAREINDLHVQHEREEQIVSRLRNNLEPTPRELRQLARLPDRDLAPKLEELERRAEETATAALAKNPAWKPLRAIRKYDLRKLVDKVRG